VKDLIKLVERHAATYPHRKQVDRLRQVELTPSTYSKLKQQNRVRVVRESSITEEEVKEVAGFLIENPDLGAERARLTLIDQEKACMSTATINEIKGELKQMTAQTYKCRKEEEKELEAQLSKDLAARQKNYHHQKAKRPDEIWAIDFVNIEFLGMALVLCVIYDEYSQKYLAIEAGDSADHEMAAATLKKARAENGREPQYLRRDNGKPFMTKAFQRELVSIKDYPIPPHSPWYNGSLESCNTSLKAAIKTLGMQKKAKHPEWFTEARKDRLVALKTLEKMAGLSQIRINEIIARTKHGVPPEIVYNGKELEAKKRRDAFCEEKRAARTKRMAEFRADPKAKPSTLKQKSIRTIRGLLKGMTTDALFVLDEALNYRFRVFEA